jgi:hypothetical protein
LRDPSKSETFCILPWVHLEVMPQGGCKICCAAREQVSENRVPMNVAASSVQEIRSSDYMRRVREALVDGRKIPACGHCWEQEGRGETSLRQQWNGRFPGAAEELDARVRNGGTATDPLSVQYLQLSLGNKCNLACRMCNASYSSRIDADPVHSKWAPRTLPDPAATSGGQAKKGRPNWADATPWFEQAEFVETDLLPMGSTLKNICVTGGEPLYTTSFERMLEGYVRRGQARNMVIGFASNLFHNEARIRRAMDLLLKFQYCEIAPSIDGHGVVYEYVRYPAKWDVVERNIRVVRALSREHANLGFKLTTVAQAYNCLNLVRLFRFADEVQIECNPHVIEEPAHLRPNVLPAALRSRAAENLLAYAESPGGGESETINRGHALRIARFLQGIADDSRRPQLWRQFLDFSRDLDQSRGQSLVKVIPELAGLVD